MKRSTWICSGLVCAAGVAVSAMELPTFKLVYPSREREAESAVIQTSGSVPPGTLSGAGGATSIPTDGGAQFAPGPSVSSTAFLNRGPSVTGTKLGLKPGETATQRALELQQEMDLSRQREDELRKKVAELNKEIDQKNARLVDAIREMNATRQELVAVKSQLEGWSTNMTELREKIRSAEADNLATMQTIIQLLQQFMQVESDMKDRSREPIDLEKLLDATSKSKGDSRKPK